LNADAVSQLNYLQHEAETIRSSPDDYKKHFRLGLLHTAQVLLGPKLAYQQKGAGWLTAFDANSFRKNCEQAGQEFQLSGETGKPLLTQIEKISRRVDQNNDSTLSDSEIIRYVGEKILYLVRF
jgi:hypothetical protein